MTTNQSPEDIKSKLNLETSRISWHDLQVYYARGHVVKVSPELDLLEVAAELAGDNTARFKSWMDGGQVGDVEPDLARHWHAENTELWAVVIAPWVLVQDRSGHVLH
ncbi:MAG: DUF2288 domain-containing protein [Marinobacter sp.]